MRRPRGAAHAAWLAALLALLVAVGLARPLLPVDETRYAAVAWEMWLRHDGLVPHLNGAPYRPVPGTHVPVRPLVTRSGVTARRPAMAKAPAPAPTIAGFPRGAQPRPFHSPWIHTMNRCVPGRPSQAAPAFAPVSNPARGRSRP